MTGKETKPRADIYARDHRSHRRGPGARCAPVGQAVERRPTRLVASRARCATTACPIRASTSLLLWSEAVARGFTSPIWMTFKQALELGGHVRKGETGTMVVYANKITKTETDEHGDDVERTIPFLRAYTVFCVDQIEDLPDHYYGRPAPNVAPAERIAHVDAFFANTGAIIRHGGDKAFFAPALDLIQMPPFESFP